jgi:uncharacterized repeat protein (TIGR01451 family)
MIKAKIGYGTIALMLVVALLAGMVGVLGTSGTALANPKSLYLAADHHTAAFDAWNINPGGTVTYQNTYTLTAATDPTGIAIDESSATLFVASEFGLAGLELINALTMTLIGYAPGPVDIAGIAVDDVNDIVYGVERWTNDLYVWDWDSSTNTITPRPGFNPYNLPGCSGAFGIALDDISGILWVCDAPAGIVRAYDTTTLLENVGLSFMPSHMPIDVTVDRFRGFVYTVSMTAGAWTPMGSGSLLLSKWDGASETTGPLPDEGVGVAVDEVTGYVYLTLSPYGRGGSQGDILVLDTTGSGPWPQIDMQQVSGSPAGICVPRSEVGFSLLDVSKDDGVRTCVDPGDTINYNVCYDNTANNAPVTGVTLVDDLPPEVTFVSATSGGIYNGGTHQVTWNIGGLAAGDPGGCETVTVTVNMGVAPGSLITNYATIDSNETGPKTVTEQTLICTEEEELVVGGEVYPVDKLGLLTPWLALSVLLIPAIILMRRRRARS